MSKALLIGTTAAGEEHFFSVTWEEGPDEDAEVDVPPALAEVWVISSDRLEEGPEIAPYPTLPITVPADDVVRSCTGFYAVAQQIFSKVRWQPWPYEEQDSVEDRVY